MRNAVLLASLILGSVCLPAQQTKPAKTDVVYGTIKEVKSGEKIVINVPNAIDKTYNLADPKTAVEVADGLAVGDPVKIMETKRNNDNVVHIVRDDRNGGQSGTRARSGNNQK